MLCPLAKNEKNLPVKRSATKAIWLPWMTTCNLLELLWDTVQLHWIAIWISWANSFRSSPNTSRLSTVVTLKTKGKMVIINYASDIQMYMYHLIYIYHLIFMTEYIFIIFTDGIISIRKFWIFLFNCNPMQDSFKHKKMFHTHQTDCDVKTNHCTHIYFCHFFFCYKYMYL